MMKSIAIAALFSFYPIAVAAQDETPLVQSQTLLEMRTADVVEIFRGNKQSQDVFGPAFLAAVPPEQFKGIITQLTTQYGPVIGVETLKPTGAFTADIAIRFERAIASGTIALSPTAPNAVEGLFFGAFAQINDSPDKVLTDLSALPGKFSVLYAPLDGGKPVLSLNADQQFAIGSTFKLYILATLARQIEAGERQWSDVVTLDRHSFPSGQMQNWPLGAPVTLHTLATMMISISDNTATDRLLSVVGRDAVEAELRSSGHSDPARTLPLLSTLEMFALKGSQDNLRKYEVADEATRRKILADFEDDIGGDRSMVTPPTFTQPLAIDTVEWFASGQDLRNLLRKLSELRDPTAREIMAVNQAMPLSVRQGWHYVGYKGGSEPGVLNMSWLLQDKAGKWSILTLSWNDPAAPVDLATMQTMSQRIIALSRD